MQRFLLAVLVPLRDCSEARTAANRDTGSGSYRAKNRRFILLNHLL